MPSFTATAAAHPNIALIKYWGDRDSSLHIPASGSISMNLGNLVTRTHVSFQPDLPCDQLILNEQEMTGVPLERVSRFLDHIRRLGNSSLFARVESANNFPIRAGVASSASAFSALALAGTAALGITLSEPDLSRLARLGSGSACRSVPSGFVEWQAGKSDDDSFAFSIAPPDHCHLVDCIAIVSTAEKEVGSSEGHLLAGTSLLQDCRLGTAPLRLAQCRSAILERDFDALAEVVELDSNLMHAVMMTSQPPLFYWQPASLVIMQEVILWRKAGIPCFYTLDAGPNVHIITTNSHAAEIKSRLTAMPGVVKILQSPAGKGAILLDNNANPLLPPD
jgi:diphosphomevalonate decarboxylase